MRPIQAAASLKVRYANSGAGMSAPESRPNDLTGEHGTANQRSSLCPCRRRGVFATTPHQGVRSGAPEDVTSALGRTSPRMGGALPTDEGRRGAGTA